MACSVPWRRPSRLMVTRPAARRTGTSADGASGTSAAGFRTGVPGAPPANLPNRTSGVAAAVAAGFGRDDHRRGGRGPRLPVGRPARRDEIRADRRRTRNSRQALGYLAEHLRWEPEEDLAKFVGDAGAHRAATFAREFAQRARRTGRNLLESIAEYLLDEDPQLVRRGELGTFGADLTRTRDALARLEKRLERLGAPAAGRATCARWRSAAAKPDSTGGAH